MPEDIPIQFGVQFAKVKDTDCCVIVLPSLPEPVISEGTSKRGNAYRVVNEFTKLWRFQAMMEDGKTVSVDAQVARFEQPTG